MNLINKKITTVFLAGCAVLALSGCGSDGTPSDTGLIPGVNDPVVPPVSDKNMTTQEVKDAMAMNALIYPIIAPIANLSDCLSSGEELEACIESIFPTLLSISPTQVSVSGRTTHTEGDFQCTRGTDLYGKYHVKIIDNKVVYTFDDNCDDYSNTNEDLHDQLAITGCLAGLDRPMSPGHNISDPNNPGTYRIEYRGSLECSIGLGLPLIKTAKNYSYRIYGNTQDPKYNWIYNGDFMLDKTKISVNSLSIQGIAKYGASDLNWTDLFKGSDETWKATNVDIMLGKALVFNGKAEYIKGDNDWIDTDPERGTGYNLFVDTSKLTYDMTHNVRDITARVSGTISSSCQPTPVTYATIEDLDDIYTLKDSEGARMPSNGMMTMNLPGYSAAPAEFSLAGNNAQVTMTSSEGATTYGSWREIVSASSCSGLLDWIDDVIPEQPPVEEQDTIEIQEGCSLNETVVIDDSNPLELVEGEEQCINAWLVHSDGSKERVTTKVLWTSENYRVASMPIDQSSSRVTGVRAGSTIVNATIVLGGITGSAPVDVSAAPY